jgi:hypothetical protein
LTPSVAISVQFTLSSERKTLKPVSLEELSVHDRWTWLVETAVAVMPLGASGTPVEAPATLE